MGQPAQVEKNRFVEQRADHETFGGNDWLGLRRDSGDLDLGDGLQRLGIGIQDLLAGREIQLLECVEGGRESSPVRAVGGDLPTMASEQLVDSFQGRC